MFFVPKFAKHDFVREDAQKLSQKMIAQLRELEERHGLSAYEHCFLNKGITYDYGCEHGMKELTEKERAQLLNYLRHCIIDETKKCFKENPSPVFYPKIVFTGYSNTSVLRVAARVRIKKEYRSPEKKSW